MTLSMMWCWSFWYDEQKWGAAWHRGSIFASHPAALGSIPRKVFSWIFQWHWDLLTVLLRVKWTEAWKCQSNPSSTCEWHASTTKKIAADSALVCSSRDSHRPRARRSEAQVWPSVSEWQLSPVANSKTAFWQLLQYSLIVSPWFVSRGRIYFDFAKKNSRVYQSNANLVNLRCPSHLDLCVPFQNSFRLTNSIILDKAQFAWTCREPASQKPTATYNDCRILVMLIIRNTT